MKSIYLFLLFFFSLISLGDVSSLLSGILVVDSIVVKDFKSEGVFIPKKTIVIKNESVISGLKNYDNKEIIYNHNTFHGVPGIRFYENGALKFGILKKEGKVNKLTFVKNTVLAIDKNGKFEFLGGSYLSHTKQEWFPIKNCYQSKGISLDGPGVKNSRESSMPKFKLHWFTCTLRERTKHHGIYWPKGSIIYGKEFDNGVLHIHTAWIPPGIKFNGVKNAVGLEMEYCLKGDNFVIIGPWKQENYDLFELDSDCNNRKGARYLKN